MLVPQPMLPLALGVLLLPFPIGANSHHMQSSAFFLSAWKVGYMVFNGIIHTSACSSRKKVEHAAFFLHWTVMEHCKAHQKRTRMHLNALEHTCPYLRLSKKEEENALECFKNTPNMHQKHAGAWPSVGTRWTPDPSALAPGNSKQHPQGK